MKPDRDVPALTCGYPMPCPHHTLVINEDDLELAVPTLAWLEGIPNVAIGAYASKRLDANGQSQIGVCAIARLRDQKVWIGRRHLPLASPMSAIRDAFDELTREAHLELEKAKPTIPNQTVQPRLRISVEGKLQVSTDDGKTYTTLPDAPLNPFSDGDEG